MEKMDKEQKTITVQEIGEIIRRDFSRKYRRFASLPGSGKLWDSLMETAENGEMLSHYQFCNDVMGIPPARVHMRLWGEQLGQLSREEKQAMGAFWGFVFKEALGYTGQQSVSCVEGGLRTATRYTRLDRPPRIQWKEDKVWPSVPDKNSSCSI